MRDLAATLIFVAAALGAFRLTYGAWPPTSGSFSQWLLSDGRARWATLVGVLAGMVATAIARSVTTTRQPTDPRLAEASECLQRARNHHQEGQVEEAMKLFHRAITLYDKFGQGDHSAQAYASLGKLYFDIGSLDLAEQHLLEAQKRFGQRPDTRPALTAIDGLMRLITEHRRSSNADVRHEDALFHFSLTVPAGWVSQDLVDAFAQTGGRLAISHISHAATFNVSVGAPGRPEWLSAEARGPAAAAYVRTAPGRVGAPVLVDGPTRIGGEANVVVVEFRTEALVGGNRRLRRNALISVVRNGLEYTLQWSAEHDYEAQTRAIATSFEFASPAPRPRSSAN